MMMMVKCITDTASIHAKNICKGPFINNRGQFSLFSIAKVPAVTWYCRFLQTNGETVHLLGTIYCSG